MMMKVTRWITAAALALTVSACGGVPPVCSAVDAARKAACATCAALSATPCAAETNHE